MLVSPSGYCFAMMVVMNNVLDNAERFDHRDTQTLLYT